jgi:hypothetical protein
MLEKAFTPAAIAKNVAVMRRFIALTPSVDRSFSQLELICLARRVALNKKDIS